MDILITQGGIKHYLIYKKNFVCLAINTVKLVRAVIKINAKAVIKNIEGS